VCVCGRVGMCVFARVSTEILKRDSGGCKKNKNDEHT